MAFWIKNPGASAVTIEDLGVGVEAGAERDLALVSGYEEIENSNDLQDFFNDTTLQRLDGPGGSVIDGDTDNVTGVAADDLGNEIAKWNANKIQGLNVDSIAPAAGDAYIWDGLVMAPGKQPIAHHDIIDPDAEDDHVQYHNGTRALSWLGGRSTDDLPEGATNQYHTDARVAAHADVAANTADRHEANKDTALDEGGAHEVSAATLNKQMIIMGHFMGSGLFGGGELAATTGLGFHVSAGSGAVNTGTGVVIVSWPDTGLSAIYPGLNEVYVDAAGAIQISADDCGDDCIPLGHLETDSGFTAILTVAMHPKYLYRFPDLVHKFVHNTIGVLVDNGLAVSEGTTPLTLFSASGELYVAMKEMVVGQKTTFAVVFRTPSGWKAGTPDVVAPDVYNDTTQTTLQATPVGSWKKDLVLRDAEGDMHLVTAQAHHASRDAALEASFPEIPEHHKETSALVAAVITQHGASAIDTILDIRPLLERVFGYGTSGAAGTVISHNSLSGLSSDDHLQYLNTVRALLWLNGRSTTDLPEGANEYHTEARVSTNTDVAANSVHRQLTAGNPHDVTPTEVGNTTAQWNASALQGHAVGVQVPTDGQVPMWASSANEYQPKSLAAIMGSALLDVYDGAGGTTVGSSWVSVPFGDVRQQTSHFTVGTDSVQIDEDGTYLVYGHLTVAITSGSSRTDSRGRLTLNGVEVGGTQVAMYHRTVNYGENSGGFMAALDLVAGDVLRLQALKDDGNSDLETLGDGSGLTIFQNKGPQGDPGPAGSGSTMVMKDGGVNVANTPHSVINFGDGLNVADAGSGVLDVSTVSVFGSDFASQQDPDEESTTSESWQTRLTLNKDVAGGQYIVHWYGEWNLNSTSDDARILVSVDGNSVAELREEPQDSGSDQYRHFSGHDVVTLAAGLRSVTLEYCISDDNYTIKFRNVKLSIWRVS